MPRAAVLIVGDEILQGHTLDTNTQYLARRLAARGIDLERVVTLPDVEEAVAAELEGLVARGMEFVFVCGGIGPTPDDRTYEAVAMAVAQPLALHPEDVAWLRARARDRGYPADLHEADGLPESMLRMIRRPEGSQRIENPVGAALGSAIRVEQSTVFVLPGVPAELRSMVEGVIEPRMLDTHSVPHEATLEVHGQEASYYPVLREVESLYPRVRIGSYPQPEPRRILIRARGPEADVAAALARVETFARQLVRRK